MLCAMLVQADRQNSFDAKKLKEKNPMELKYWENID